jgi:hypothetical protein
MLSDGEVCDLVSITFVMPSCVVCVCVCVCVAIGEEMVTVLAYGRLTSDYYFSFHRVDLFVGVL